MAQFTDKECERREGGERKRMEGGDGKAARDERAFIPQRPSDGERIARPVERNAADGTRGVKGGEKLVDVVLGCGYRRSDTCKVRTSFCV